MSTADEVSLSVHYITCVQVGLDIIDTTENHDGTALVHRGQRRQQVGIMYFSNFVELQNLNNEAEVLGLFL